MEEKNFRLIQKCMQGDTLAKGWLYKKYSPLLLGVCLRYIPDKMQAEDILHESFIVIFNKIKDLKDEQAIVGWMKRIVVNNALKQLKSQHNFYAIDRINETVIDETDAPSPGNIKEQILQLDISQQDMLEIINGLPAGFRAIFNLYVFENYRHDEIAEELGISPSTSRSQLLRARKLIQKKLYELVQARKKSRKGEKVILASLMLMNDDLDYIDKLATDKLSNYCPVSSSSPGYFDKEKNSGNVISTGLKQKLVLFAGKKIIWIPTLFIGISGITLGVFSQHNKAAKPVSVQQQIKEIETKAPQAIDTLIQYPIVKEENPTNENTNDIPKKNTFTTTDTIIKKEVVHRKVMMKKVVTVKTEKAVTDTIKK